MNNDKLSTDFSSVKSVVSNLKSDKVVVSNAYSKVSQVNVGDNYSLSASLTLLTKNLKTLDDKLGIVITKTSNFESYLEQYEDTSDNIDFTIATTNSDKTPSVGTDKGSNKEETTTQYKKIVISNETLWNLAIKNGYKGSQWQQIFRDANGNVISEKQASRLKKGDVIYLVGLGVSGTVDVTAKTTAKQENNEGTVNVPKSSGNNTYTDNESLLAYIQKYPAITSSNKRCSVYARERANAYYKDEYNSYFSDSRGITYAKDFDDAYRNLSGYSVSTTPSVGSIMIFEANAAGASSSGHAAFVESVSDDGNTIIISETNWSGSGIQTRVIKNAKSLSGVSYVRKNV